MIDAFRPAGFQSRLLLAFTALLIIAVATAGIAVAITSAQQVRAQMHEKVMVGTRVLQSHLQARQQQLAAAVRVLTNDFGFKSAVATADTATIMSTLANHGARIGADLMVLIDDRGRAVSADGPVDLQQLPLGSSLDQARSQGQAYAIGAHAGSLYQFFVVPVLAPTPVASVMVAFAIDEALADDLARLTDLGVGFIAIDATQQVVAAQPRQPSAYLGALRAPLAGLDAAAEVEVRDTHSGTYLTALQPLDEIDGTRTFAVLQMPTRLISETVRLQLVQVALVLMLALVAALLASVWLARRMSQPVHRLIDAARSIEQGDYDAPLATDVDGELALLGSALKTMRGAIRDREARIQHQMDHDALTDLPNLRYLERHHDVGSPPYTLGLLSVLNLKDVSFSLGYETADALLVAIAGRLRGEADVSTLARVSGHEFAVVLPEMTAEAAVDRIRQLVALASGTYAIAGRTVSSRSAGAVIAFPRDADRFETLFRRLETTLTGARTQTERCAAYLPGQEAARARQLEIIASFDAAFADDQFHLQFQPKVSLPQGDVSECEALLRWVHPTLGFIPPDEFILLAERSGNIRRLTDWVLNAALAQAAEWHRTGLDMVVAVNLSAHDVADADLHRVVEDAMQRHGVQGSLLVLEVTESAVMQDRDHAAAALHRLKALGIRISIDDFGTGHSSLAQLKQLPVDELKIDKSFVLELDRSPDDALIVRSTIDLGHNLGLSVVAEGVENAGSLNLLVDYACDKVQGYYFSRPLPRIEFERWLRDRAGTAWTSREAAG